MWQWFVLQICTCARFFLFSLTPDEGDSRSTTTLYFQLLSREQVNKYYRHHYLLNVTGELETTKYIFSV